MSVEGITVPGIEIGGYRPGALGRVTELHATYYHHHWGFDLYFESKVASELSEFLTRFDPARDGFWVASRGETIVGSISIDGSLAGSEGARLRWFILAPGCQGQGIGNKLMDAAMEFCGRAGFEKIFLWTFAGLDAAGHLYEKFGFELSLQQEDDQWGKSVTEQKYTRQL